MEIAQAATLYYAWDMENPSTDPDNRRIQNPEDAQEIAIIANEIIDHTARAHDGHEEITSDEHDAELHYAFDIAEVHAKYAHDDRIKKAKAAVHAAADVIAPDLAHERDEAKRAAMTDSLTGLANQAALTEALPTAERDPNVFVISFDGDNFGSINKIHHQEAGDAAIIALAEAINKSAADSGNNRVFRGGGDEFYVLASRDEADAIIAGAQMHLSERIANGQALADARGNEYPANWYEHLGISGSYAKTRVEADAQMQTIKKAKKAKAAAN